MAGYPSKNHTSSHGSYPQAQRRHGGHPVIRWDALATGSLVGISTWALAYTLGATLVVMCRLDPGAMPVWGQLALGVYGAVTASMALAFAAYTAARTGGARTTENAFFYGLCLWSMSTITLVAVTTLAGLGAFTPEMLRAAPLLAVGLAAVGSLPGALQAASAGTLGAVLGTLLFSLWAALWGGLRARQDRRSAPA